MGATVLTLWLAVSSIGALFPTPLHLVRRIDDPISGKSETVEEFCSGNRIITVNGPRVVIADYGQQVVTEIDHRLLNYSITRFDEIAKALPPPAAAKSSAEWKVSALGNAYEITRGSETVRVTVDRGVSLTREAVEVLVGAAYPRRRSEEQEQVMRAAAPPGSGRIAAQSEAQYGLPLEQSVTWEDGLTMHSVIVRVDHDLPPPRLLVIDPGATRVESRLTRTARELQQLDALPRH